MATYDKKMSIGSLTAENDLSAKLHHFVKVGTVANTVDAAGAGELVIGVLNNKPEAGEAAEVSRGLVVQVVAGAAVAIGDEVVANAAGRAITGATSTHRIAGVALEAAAADGEEIRVLFQPGASVP